jgi:predicted TIM-barrel fold metal-dependent hydrolase
VIIDGHCHAGRSDALTAPWTTGAPLGRYLRRARAAGIDRTVVMPTFPADSWRANREVASMIAARPHRLAGFAWVNPHRDAGDIAGLLDDALARGLRGVKVHAHEAPLGREVCEAAAARGLPVLVDVVGRGHVIDLFAPAYPQVTFIVPHLGSFADDWRAHRVVIDALVRHPNVYADTSGVRRFDYLVEAVQTAGPRKLIFGSDGPWLHPQLELQKVRLLALPAREEAMILGGTMRRILTAAGRPDIPRRRRGRRRSIHAGRARTSRREHENALPELAPEFERRRAMRGQAGRHPAGRLASHLRGQGFIPTAHFLQRFVERLQREGLRYEPRRFGRDFDAARHARQTRPGKTTNLAWVWGVPIVYRRGGQAGNRIVLVTTLPAGADPPHQVIAAPSRELSP